MSCALARTEIVRAVSPSGQGAIARARRLPDGIELIQLDDELLDLAGELEGPLRSLDAIHLAAELELGEAVRGGQRGGEAAPDAAKLKARLL